MDGSGEETFGFGPDADDSAESGAEDALGAPVPVPPPKTQKFAVAAKAVRAVGGFRIAGKKYAERMELQDAQEQLSRFEHDNIIREKEGLQPQPIDQHLIDALTHGLPNCAGVALGIDRLIMLAINKQHINQVISFDVNRC